MADDELKAVLDRAENFMKLADKVDPRAQDARRADAIYTLLRALLVEVHEIRLRLDKDPAPEKT